MRFFNIHSVAKHEKIEENKNFHFREKISQCRKKLKGDFGIFQHPFCRKTSKKMQGGPFGEKLFFSKKVSQCRKNERGESLVSPGMVCYAEKQEKPFWFSSLDQLVHFDAIIFCRTFVELFWSVRVDRKKSHYNSRVSLHEAPTKKKQREQKKRDRPLRTHRKTRIVRHPEAEERTFLRACGTCPDFECAGTSPLSSHLRSLLRPMESTLGDLFGTKD